VESFECVWYSFVSLVNLHRIGHCVYELLPIYAVHDNVRDANCHTSCVLLSPDWIFALSFTSKYPGMYQLLAQSLQLTIETFKSRGQSLTFADFSKIQSYLSFTAVSRVQ
jgi:hypothetical protein